jgi:DNA-binding LacI/PurR family transcriptional regulator
MADELLALIADPDGERQHVVLDTELILRDST